MVNNLQSSANSTTFPVPTLPNIGRAGAQPSTEASPATDAAFEPRLILEVELSRPLPDVYPYATDTGTGYRHALALVRLHTIPLGMVELELDGAGLTAAELAAQLWGELASEIVQHLVADGLPAPQMLGAEGLAATGTPQCVSARAQLLADAPFVSVIVATRNRAASLGNCLDALLNLAYPNYEIIVVDNAPSDESTAKLIRTHYSAVSAVGTRVRYVREDRPGLATAHNAGVRATVAPIVAFTDDDVVVDEHWLTELVLGFQSAPNVGCVTGMILPAELETAPQIWIEQYSGFSKGFARKVFDLDMNRPDNPLFPYVAGTMGSGASMAFTRAALEQIGGFDPALGAGSKGVGGDDLAAFFDIVTHGFTLVYNPASLLYHWHRRDYDGLRKQAYGYGVGLFAFLTKTVIDRPTRLLDFVIKLPQGLHYILSAKSPKNRNKQSTYPQELTWVERKGMLYGPLAYLQSRWHTTKAA